MADIWKTRLNAPDLLFRNVRPVSPEGCSSRHDGTEVLDIRIRDGRIAEIGNGLPSGESGDPGVVDMEGACVSPGWMDMHVHLREPGFEHKETIETGCRSAAFGGFTAVACMPNTSPATHTRDVVEFIRHRAEHLPVAVHPIGAVTRDRKGRDLTEMADMKEGGAVAFSDDGDPVHDALMMRIALDYSRMLDLPIINHEEDLALSRPGHMHEGEVSTRLGLDGTPSIAEEVMIARDILLAELTGGHVHVAHLSTRRGMELIREAKAKGIRVTTEVCPHHFDLTHEEVERRRFDTNVKMHPPLRTTDDVSAMIEGLRDGTIDALCTDHAPHSVEEKEVEFMYAPNGVIGLDTAWSICVQRLLDPGHLSLAALISKWTIAPRRILHLPYHGLGIGVPAELTFFNTDEAWTYTTDRVHSKSLNSPYLGQELKGRALGIYNKSQWVANPLD
jgi:dihydroorotase